MELKTYKTFWGHFGPWSEKLEALKEGKFNGIEARVPSTAQAQKEARQFLEKEGFEYIAILITGGGIVPVQSRTVDEHLQDLETQLESALKMNPVKLNLLVGNDRWSFTQQVEFFTKALEIVKKCGVPFGFETHRSRALSTPWSTLDLIERIPDLRFTCDISHWVVFCERLLNDPLDDLTPFIERVNHTQARVGYDQGPQVPHPFDPQYSKELEFHQQIWDKIWAAQQKRGFEVTTMTPEFGPDGYLHHIPFTNEPVGDLDELNKLMALHERTCFEKFVADGKTTATAFKEIPVIDISGLYSDKLEDRQKVADELGRAAREVGFLHVKGHKVSDQAISGLQEAAKEYFAQPFDKKMENYIGFSKSHKGFVPRGEEAYGSGKPDLKEAFDVGFEVPEDHPLVQAKTPLLGPNKWPALPGFQENVSRYYSEAFALGNALFRGFALALGLDEDYFKDMNKVPPSKLRMIHYPYDAEAVDVQGIGAHTDYECFTILLSNAPGLEVLNSEQEWIDAPPVEGAFVVNIGDMFEIMTNGAFVATAHRVRKVSQERYSFPLFYACDYYTQVGPLPQFDNGDQHYDEVTLGEHMWSQSLQTYEYLKKKIADGEMKLYEKARKPGSFGQLGKQGITT